MDLEDREEVKFFKRIFERNQKKYALKHKYLNDYLCLGNFDIDLTPYDIVPTCQYLFTFEELKKIEKKYKVNIDDFEFIDEMDVNWGEY